MGKSLADARNGGSSGCVEVGAFGKENYNLTGYFNLPKVLELTLHNGVDPRTGKQIGLETGDPRQFPVFRRAVRGLREAAAITSSTSRCAATTSSSGCTPRYMPAPFLSLLIDDCIANGRDYHDGGARYNTSLHPGRGPGHDHRCAVGHQVPRLRAEDAGDGRPAGGAGGQLCRAGAPAPDCC